MEALGFNLGFLFLQILAFIILFLTLNAWVYQPMLNMMETRKQKIAQGLEDARVSAQAREDAEKQASKIISDAQAEASKIVADATERAAVAGRDVKAAAEAEAAKTRDAAIAEAEVERNRVLGDLRGQVASLAIAAANKLVGEALDEKNSAPCSMNSLRVSNQGKLSFLTVLVSGVILPKSPVLCLLTMKRKPRFVRMSSLKWAQRMSPSASIPPFWADWSSKSAIRSWMVLSLVGWKVCAKA